MTEILLTIVGLLIGLTIGFLFCSIRKSKLIEELKEKSAAASARYDSVDKSRQEAVETLASERLRYQRDIESVRERTHAEEMKAREELMQRIDAEHSAMIKAIDTRHNQAIASQELRNKEALEAQAAKFEETIAKMREEVTNITKQMLEERQREFGASSNERLSQLMKPLQENIRNMSQIVKDNTDKNTLYSGQLREGIENVLKQSQQAMQSADRLSNVLSASNKVQGNFGERILSELLESSGLKEGIHYDTQVSVTDEKGHRIQPDVVLHIDNERNVIIDSKVSLTAFYRYMEASSEEDKQKYLKEHISSLKTQANRLAEKDYSLSFPGAIDYVIMFVPITSALYVATQTDSRLWREAMDRKVYIADEQTLYAALKIISINWRQQAQAENQLKMYKLAGEMLKRVSDFASKFQSMGNNLKKAQSDYEDACKKLAEGGQSIPVTCRKMIKLGAPYDNKKKNQLDAMMDDAQDAEQIENS